MARMAETKELARTIRRHALSAVQTQGLRVFTATVNEVAPLVVTLTLHDEIVIEETDLILGSWPRFYDHAYGIKVNDELVMLPLDSGDWFVIDVVSQSTFERGFDATQEAALSRDWQAEAVGGSGTVTFGTVVAKVPFFDASGNQIGVALLFDPTTL